MDLRLAKEVLPGAEDLQIVCFYVVEGSVAMDKVFEVGPTEWE